MLQEIKIIPCDHSISPRRSAQTRTIDKEWEREDKALLEQWPDTSPSPPQTPLDDKKTNSRGAGKRRPRPRRSRGRGTQKHCQHVARPKTRPVTQDPSFDRSLWRRGTIVSVFDREAKKWVEGLICRVEPDKFKTKIGSKVAKHDGLHILYQPAKKLKPSWVWKNHKPIQVSTRGKGRRARVVKKPPAEDITWEASILLSRTSRRLRPAIRIVWDPDLRSYLHEEPEECSSSEEEPEEYSSGEEAEQFWSTFRTWKGHEPRPQSQGGQAPMSADNQSFSKDSRQTFQSNSQRTQTTQRSQRTQGTFNTMTTNNQSAMSMGVSTTMNTYTNGGIVEEEELEVEDTESESDGEI